MENKEKQAGEHHQKPRLVQAMTELDCKGEEQRTSKKRKACGDQEQGEQERPERKTWRLDKKDPTGRKEQGQLLHYHLAWGDDGDADHPEPGQVVHLHTQCEGVATEPGTVTTELVGQSPQIGTAGNGVTSKSILFFCCLNQKNLLHVISHMLRDNKNYMGQAPT